MSHFHQQLNTYFKLGTFLSFYWVAWRYDSSPRVRFPRQLHHTFRKLERKYSEQKLLSSVLSACGTAKTNVERRLSSSSFDPRSEFELDLQTPRCDSIHWLFGLIWPSRPALVILNEMKSEMLLSSNEKTNTSYKILLQWVTTEQQKNWELSPRFSRLGVPITGVDLKFSLERSSAVT